MLAMGQARLGLGPPKPMGLMMAHEARGLLLVYKFVP